MTRYRVLFTDSWGERRGYPVTDEVNAEYMKTHLISKGYTNVVIDEFDPEELKKQDEIKKIAEEKAQAELKEKENIIKNVVCAIIALAVLIIAFAHVSLVWIVIGVVGIGVLRLMLPFIANVINKGFAILVFLIIAGIVITAFII